MHDLCGIINMTKHGFDDMKGRHAKQQNAEGEGQYKLAMALLKVMGEKVKGLNGKLGQKLRDMGEKEAQVVEEVDGEIAKIVEWDEENLEQKTEKIGELMEQNHKGLHGMIESLIKVHTNNGKIVEKHEKKNKK